MSRRHKEQETESNYKPQSVESHADGHSNNLRWTNRSSSLLDMVLTVNQTDSGAFRLLTEKITASILKAVAEAFIDKKIALDDNWVKIPRSYFENESFSLDIGDEVIEETTHGRGRRFWKRLVNTVEDSKIVSYVKRTYKAAEVKCKELIENATQFCACCLKGLFKTFAPDDDPYQKLSHYHRLLEHEISGLKGRRQLSNYYKWFVDWRPAVTYESPKDKKEKFRHKLWERLIDWICEYLLKLAPQYAFA